ncbi:hypothetical protein ACOME3_008054 [Neoechinorhynchus agilis]
MDEEFCCVCKIIINSDEKIILSNGMVTHLECLRCQQCQQEMSNKRTCFFNDGFFYCQAHIGRYATKFCISCCYPILNGHSMVSINDNNFNFHYECFRCSICAIQLKRGDLYGACEFGNLYCPAHFPFKQAQRQIRSVPANSDCHKIVQKRTNLTASQRRILIEAFKEDPRPDRYTRQELANQTGLLHRTVRIWFQNRRCEEMRRKRMQQHAL